MAKILRVLNIIWIVLRVLWDMLFPSRETRRELAEAKRKSLLKKPLFVPGADLLGKDIHYIIDKVGPYTDFGGMDHGKDCARWCEVGYVANLDFEGGRCVSVVVT